jgi:thymidylate synthase (FAD)
MKIIEPKVEFITPIDADVIMKRLELIGRVCYKSEGRIAEGSAEKFLRNIIRRGHESILEHSSFSVRFTVDRGVSHEIVRHRMASYAQESTRYVKYDEVTFIKPCYLEVDTPAYNTWHAAMYVAENSYRQMIDHGSTPQQARAVLPTSTKTELIMTANIREWRHFLRLRCSKAAHPQMREVANIALKEFKEKLPLFFSDIEPYE